MIISGNDDDENDEDYLSSVEFLGNNGCSIPDFPFDIYRHVAVMTHDGIFLVCGGSSQGYGGKDCFQYDPHHKTWTDHSGLRQKRKASTAVSVR